MYSLNRVSIVGGKDHSIEFVRTTDDAPHIPKREKHVRRFAIGIVIVVGLCAGIPMTHAGDNGVELFMRDGQLKSHPVRVFLTHDVTEAMNPRLVLAGSHSVSKEHPDESKSINPKWIARNQTVSQVKDGAPITVTGTLMLFDLKDYPIPFYKGMMRVVPIVYWDETGPGAITERRAAVGPHEVNVGNIGPAVFWTAIIITTLLLIIIALAKAGKRNPLFLICSQGGRLSLARSQITLWTVGIGSTVTAYGLIRFDVPEIPESLVALMGMSLATGGVSHFQGWRSEAHPARKGVQETAQARRRYQPKLSHLVTDADADGKESLSLARAQMIFWTGVTLILFVVKSTLDGILWQVPWEVVWLMGMSQVGYLSPKMLKTAQTGGSVEPATDGK